MKAEYDLALADIRGGLMNWPMWSRLGWREIKVRYRRTVFGPFWNTLSLAVFILAISVVWAMLWNMPLREFLPFVTAGMLTWTLIAALVSEGTTVFTSAETLIKSLKFPYTTLTCALVCKNTLMFAHNLVIYVLVVLFTGVKLTWASLLFFPGLLIVFLNGLWVATLFGLFGARFRDVPLLITTLLQVMLFITPVFWTYEQLKGKLGLVLIKGNLLLQFIEVLRMPMLGRAPELYSWIAVLAVTVLGWAATLYMYARFRRRVPYWL